jgi:hypothetical protein
VCQREKVGLVVLCGHRPLEALKRILGNTSKNMDWIANFSMHSVVSCRHAALGDREYSMTAVRIFHIPFLFKSIPIRSSPGEGTTSCLLKRQEATNQFANKGGPGGSVVCQVTLLADAKLLREEQWRFCLLKMVWS